MMIPWLVGLAGCALLLAVLRHACAERRPYRYQPTHRRPSPRPGWRLALHASLLWMRLTPHLVLIGARYA